MISRSSCLTCDFTIASFLGCEDVEITLRNYHSRSSVVQDAGSNITLVKTENRESWKDVRSMETVFFLVPHLAVVVPVCLSSLMFIDSFSLVWSFFWQSTLKARANRHNHNRTRRPKEELFPGFTLIPCAACSRGLVTTCHGQSANQLTESLGP